MPLRFVGPYGSDGWIGNDLSVSYDGPEDVAGQVESYVDGGERDERGDEDVLQELMIDLYTQGGIRKIERVEGDSGPTPGQ